MEEEEEEQGEEEEEEEGRGSKTGDARRCTEPLSALRARGRKRRVLEQCTRAGREARITASMIGITGILVAIAAISVLWVALRWRKHLRYVNREWKELHHPPGAAVAFGKGPPVNFVRQCFESTLVSEENRYRAHPEQFLPATRTPSTAPTAEGTKSTTLPSGLGRCFTLHVAGRQLTYLFDPAYFPCFFTPEQHAINAAGEQDGECIDFQFATQPFLTRCFGVEKEAYFKHHHAMLNSVRSGLSPKQVELHYAEPLYTQFANDIDTAWPRDEGEVMLLEALHDIVFQSSISVLFGNGHEGIAALSKEFLTFDRNFELASADIPHVFLPAFTKAKGSLLQTLEAFQKANDLTGENVIGRLLHTVGEECFANWLLGFLWAAEANSIIAAFWALIDLMKHAEHMQRVVRELEELVEADGPGSLSSYKKVAKLGYLRACILESVRRHSPVVILRGVRADTRIGPYIIPAGNFLCLSPYWTHRDEMLFENGAEYIPERFIGDSAAANESKLLSFGKAAWRCPGKWFAMHELAVLVGLVLLKYDMKLSVGTEFPDIDRMGLVGIPKPEVDVAVHVKRR